MGSAIIIELLILSAKQKISLLDRIIVNLPQSWIRGNEILIIMKYAGWLLSSINKFPKTKGFITSEIKSGMKCSSPFQPVLSTRKALHYYLCL